MTDGKRWEHRLRRRKRPELVAAAEPLGSNSFGYRIRPLRRFTAVECKCYADRLGNSVTLNCPFFIL